MLLDMKGSLFIMKSGSPKSISLEMNRTNRRSRSQWGENPTYMTIWMEKAYERNLV
jgi:hypothetical protein